MRASDRVASTANPDRIAIVILAATQGGLVMSQRLRSAWPLEAALDPLHQASTTAAVENAASRSSP